MMKVGRGEISGGLRGSDSWAVRTLGHSAVCAILAFALLILGSACSLAPTKARTDFERKFDAGELQAPVVIDANTIVLDARSSFEFSMAHIPQSISMRWTDFTQVEAEARGVLQTDLYALARRLARYGIGPSTKVVVVGQGLGGKGEEGRLAWTLAYLGVTRVQFAPIDSLKARMTNSQDDPRVASVPQWKPDLVESLNVSRSELLDVINRSGRKNSMAAADSGGPNVYRIIDTRSANDYLGKSGFGAKRQVPNMDAVNIPWREFFDSSMRPRAGLVERLGAVGIQRHHRVIVLSDDGVASAAVTLALRSLGFSNAGNLSGGLEDLMAAYSFR